MTKTTFPGVFITIISVLCFYCAAEWSFNLPYYLLFGDIEDSVDQPFVSTHCECIKSSRTEFYTQK